MEAIGKKKERSGKWRKGSGRHGRRRESGEEERVGVEEVTLLKSEICVDMRRCCILRPCLVVDFITAWIIPGNPLFNLRFCSLQ